MSAFLRKYNTASHVYVPIIKRGVVDFAVSADWTPAAGDVKVSKDGGTAANIGTLPSAVTMGNTACWDFTLTATELSAKKITVTVADAATKAVEDQAFLVETYGNASAEHPFDFGTATQAVNVTQFGGSAGTFASGRPEVNTTHIAGTAQTAKDLGALNVTTVNTLAGHDPGETIMGATDLGTGAGFTSLASASALSTLQGNVTTLLGRLVALAVAAGAVASGTASATAFPTDLTETADGHWNDAFLVFTTGDLAGQVKRIADYDGTSKTITVSGGFTAAPSEGDAFAIVNR